MHRPHKQFDPSQQFDAVMIEIEAAIGETLANFERLQRLRKKIADEYAAAIAEIERLEIFTEAEAAKILKTTPRMLAKWRQRYRIPHFLAGREVRYTKEHLSEIPALLEINGKPRKALQATPRLKAA